jgi:hypothetical protein
MFCMSCGSELPDGSLACPHCGSSFQAGLGAARNVTDGVTAASRDAFDALRIFLLDPVGGLRLAYENLEPSRALAVGAVFGLLFTISLSLGVNLGLRVDTLSDLLDELSGGFLDISLQVSFGRLILLGLLGFVSMTAAAAVTRLIFRGVGGFDGDCFIAGACLLPVGFFVLVSGLLGGLNLEVLVLLALFAVCYAILIMYSGLTQVSAVSPRGAAFAVPVMIALSAWLSKVVFVAVVIR